MSLGESSLLAHEYPIAAAQFVEKGYPYSIELFCIFVKNKLNIFVQVYFWFLSSFSFIYMFIVQPIPTILITVAIQKDFIPDKIIPPIYCTSFSKLFQVFQFLSFNSNFKIIFYLYTIFGSFIRILFNLHINFWKIDIFTAVILPTHDHGIYFHLFRSSLISISSLL